jgi:hypothetical protein
MDQDTHTVIGKIEGMEFTTAIGSRIFVGTSNLNNGVYVQMVSPDGHMTRLQLSREGAACLGKLISGESDGATPFEIQHEHIYQPPKFEWRQMPLDTEGFMVDSKKPRPNPSHPWRDRFDLDVKISEAALAGSGPAPEQPPSSQQMPEDPSEPG